MEDVSIPALTFRKPKKVKLSTIQLPEEPTEELEIEEPYQSSLPSVTSSRPFVTEPQKSPTFSPVSVPTPVKIAPTPIMEDLPEINQDLFITPLAPNISLAPTPPQQSLAPTQSLIPPNQVTSPTPADKAFYAPAKQQGGNLVLPSNWKQSDLDKAKTVAEKHGLSPTEFMAIIQHETAGTFSPKIKNEIGATGLIQFVPTTAAELMLDIRRAQAIERATVEGKESGLTDEELMAKITKAQKDNPKFWQIPKERQSSVAAMAQAEFEKMPISDQLTMTDKYLEKRAKGKKGLDNIYSAIFQGTPTSSGIPQGTKAYENNKGLDKDQRDGISRDEWLAPIKRKAAALKDIKIAKE
jgi:hypothetical protein